MADIQPQGQVQTVRSGFFDRNAFRQKSRSILVLKTAVAGLKYHVNPDKREDRELLESLIPGTELLLLREPDNIYDQWAISVCAPDRRKLGHVTQFKNEPIARLMDDGRVFKAFVDQPVPPDPNARVYQRSHAPTEDYRLPFSIYMID